MSGPARNAFGYVPRTVRLDDTLIVVDHVRAARVEPRYSSDPESRGEWVTTVWLSGAMHPVSVFGDHIQTIADAIEAREPRP